MKFFLAILTVTAFAFSQKAGVKSPRTMYSTHIGATKITVDYGRPSAKGRTVFGGIIKYGPQNSKGRPWRTGANQNTTITFSTDVKIEGQMLKAGSYGFFTIPGEKEWVLIFSKVSDKWGSFSYKKSDDALRVTVKSMAAPMMESFNFGMSSIDVNSGTMYFAWEKTMVGFKISI